MSHRRTRPKLSRRVIGVALCYVLALQAFLAAYGTALALARTPAAEFPICHSSGDDSFPAGPQPSRVPCAICALAAAASGLLPPPASLADVPPTPAAKIRDGATAIALNSPPARAGLARAPPRFA